MESKVAKRYAQALFNIAVKDDVVLSVESDLDAIKSLIGTDKSFHSFLFSPKVGREEKVAIADKLFSDRVTALTMHMLRLMLVKRREGEFEQMCEEFVKLRREFGNTIFADITSAETLDESLKSKLIAKLETQTGKRVEARYRVDASLIGGVRVAYDNYVLDGSVRGSFNRLRDSLRHDFFKQP